MISSSTATVLCLMLVVVVDVLAVAEILKAAAAAARPTIEAPHRGERLPVPIVRPQLTFEQDVA